jgi:hypothetical protein
MVALAAALMTCLLASTVHAKLTEVRVKTPQQLADAITKGTKAIVITQHMDMSCNGVVRCDKLTPLVPLLATRSIRVRLSFLAHLSHSALMPQVSPQRERT